MQKTRVLIHFNELERVMAKLTALPGDGEDKDGLAVTVL